ncbi:MAG: transcriptional regulator, partial [Bacteroidales bacterium]|nr:transcriptional regulator [Bacteroidales bacterium]
HKTTELSDMALLLAGKNEILGSLKNDISEIYKEPKLPPLLKAKLAELTSKIEGNIQNDNLIDRFEEQFDLLHNNFIKKLKVIHPSLSRNDYMLCAYIRMGFSTKEIAQMFNMSVRGVESIKYRFKKKIGIEGDISEYLQGVEEK